MKRFIAIAACALALVLLAVLFWPGDDQTPPASATPTPVANTSPASTAADAPPPSLSAPPTNLAAASVTFNGFTLHLQSDGSLLVEPSIRELFDALARQHRQTPVEQWKPRFLAEIGQQLGEPALQQLSQLLDNYGEYNLALQLMPLSGDASLQQAINEVQKIRQDYLGKDADGLFADWQEMETFTHFYVNEVVNYTTVDDLQNYLQQQIADLPANVQPRAQRMLEHSEQLYPALRTARPDPETLTHMAERVAAISLIQPDFEFGDPTPDFMNRFNQYQQAKRQLAADEPIASENDPRLQALQEQYFSGAELLRIKTLDRSQLF